MNPNEKKTEKGVKSKNFNSNKKSSGKPGNPEKKYLARCRPFSDQLVTSDIYSAQEGFEYLYINYRKANPEKTESKNSKKRRLGGFSKHGLKNINQFGLILILIMLMKLPKILKKPVIC
ncbi:unnamed protein product [marine sediment metagenome]|uniref:Uncharacterized protein n=1 Tax=marine sediment metagenome TaxID=412755 RepID=X1A3X1_9ZZZZ